MIGPMKPAHPRPPDQRRKNNYRQQEEDAGDLEPKDSAYPAKGTQKTAHTSHNAAARSSSGPADSLCIGRPGPGPAIRDADCASGLRGALKSLRDRTAGETDANTKNTANGLGLHPFMMVPATRGDAFTESAAFPATL